MFGDNPYNDQMPDRPKWLKCEASYIAVSIVTILMFSLGFVALVYWTLKAIAWVIS